MVTPASDVSTAFLGWIDRHLNLAFFALVLINVVRTGFRFQPNFDEAIVNPSLTASISDAIDTGAPAHLTSSYLMPYVFRMMNVRDSWIIYVSYVIVVILLLLVCYRLVAQTPNRSTRAAGLIIFTTSPVVWTSFNWLGHDSVFLLLTAGIVLLQNSYPLALLLAVLLGMHHFELGFIGLLVWLLFSHFTRSQRELFCAPNPLRIIFMMSALVVGRGILNVLLRNSDLQPDNNRLTIFPILLKRSLADAASSGHSVIWSLLAWLWVPVVVILRSRIGVWRSLAILVIPIAVSVTTLDHSRTGMLSLSFLVLGSIVPSRAFTQYIPPNYLFVMSVVSILTPRIWVWEGNLIPSCFPANVVAVIDWLIGIGDIVSSECRIYAG